MKKKTIVYGFENIDINFITEYKIIKHDKYNLDARKLLDMYRRYRASDFQITSGCKENTDCLITDQDVYLSMIIYCMFRSRSYDEFINKLCKFHVNSIVNMNIIYNCLIEDKELGIVTKTMILPEIPKLFKDIKCSTCINYYIKCNAKDNLGCMKGIAGDCKNFSNWRRKAIEL